MPEGAASVYSAVKCGFNLIPPLSIVIGAQGGQVYDAAFGVLSGFGASLIGCADEILRRDPRLIKANKDVDDVVEDVVAHDRPSPTFTPTDRLHLNVDCVGVFLREQVNRFSVAKRDGN